MQKRTYPAGRPIDGFTYGDQVETVAEVSVGDILIYDSHQFKATNLIRRVPMPEGFIEIEGRELFYAVYVDSNGERIGPEMFCVWYWELTNERYGLFSYYRAVPVQLNGRCDRCLHGATETVTTRHGGQEHLCKPCAANVQRDGQVVHTEDNHASSKP